MSGQKRNADGTLNSDWFDVSVNEVGTHTYAERTKSMIKEERESGWLFEAAAEFEKNAELRKHVAAVEKHVWEAMRVPSYMLRSDDVQFDKGIDNPPPRGQPEFLAVIEQSCLPLACGSDNKATGYIGGQVSGQITRGTEVKTLPHVPVSAKIGNDGDIMVWNEGVVAWEPSEEQKRVTSTLIERLNQPVKLGVSSRGTGEKKEEWEAMSHAFAVHRFSETERKTDAEIDYDRAMKCIV